MRTMKTYSGDLMEIGTENEEILLKWLKTDGGKIIDFREFRLAQRIDVDFGIISVDGDIILAEIKSDQHISEDGNLCFENHRINHFAKGHWFYLGWGWRSPAQKLIIRNPKTNETFVFDFLELRTWLGEFIGRWGQMMLNRNYISIVETDNQKTTFNLLIPMKKLTTLYSKYIVQ